MEAVLADGETLAMNELGVNLVHSSDRFLFLMNTYNVSKVFTDGEITVSVMFLLAVSFANLQMLFIVQDHRRLSVKY